jgi:HKD family nuclease
LIAPIDNRGPNTLKRALRVNLRSAVEVRLQVAFSTRAGVLELLSSLLGTANHGSVRIMTGLYEGFTEPAALRLLADAERKTRGRLQVRICREPRFHRKLYLIRSPKRGTSIVGSSNLTTEGLTKPDELNLLVSDKLTNQPFRGLAQKFDNEWRHNSVPVTAAIIDEYDAVRPDQIRRPVRLSTLRKILGSTPTERSLTKKRQEGGPQPNLWRQSVVGVASRKTHDVIEDETSWNRFDWYSTASPSIGVRDLILLFDSSGKRKTVSLVQVRDTTKVSVFTPDGRDFVAYTMLAGYSKRRLGAQLWKKLAEVGVIRLRRDAWKARKLSLKNLGEIKSLLRRRKRAG